MNIHDLLCELVPRWRLQNKFGAGVGPGSFEEDLLMAFEGCSAEEFWKLARNVCGFGIILIFPNFRPVRRKPIPKVVIIVKYFECVTSCK